MAPSVYCRPPGQKPDVGSVKAAGRRPTCRDVQVLIGPPRHCGPGRTFGCAFYFCPTDGTTAQSVAPLPYIHIPTMSPVRRGGARRVKQTSRGLVCSQSGEQSAIATWNCPSRCGCCKSHGGPSGRRPLQGESPPRCHFEPVLKLVRNLITKEKIPHRCAHRFGMTVNELDVPSYAWLCQECPMIAHRALK